MNITAFDLAQRYVGVHEFDGMASHPLVQWWLSRTAEGDVKPGALIGDETPWCSAFVNGIAWELRLPRSKSLAARSWLTVGLPVIPALAAVGFDVVVLSRGTGTQPGPEVLAAPGHVGFFAGLDAQNVHILGGNQADQVSVQPFPRTRLLGIRRLLAEPTA